VEGKTTPVLPLVFSPAPAQTSDQPADQLVLIKGFDDVIVAAHVEATDDVFDRAPGSDKDDRNVGHLSQSAADLKAVDIGHHHIQKNCIRMTLVGSAESSHCIVCCNDVKPFVFEHNLQEVERLWLVVNCENPEPLVHRVPSRFFLPICPRPHHGHRQFW
jgi:hypothetical protein